MIVWFEKNLDQNSGKIIGFNFGSEEYSTPPRSELGSIHTEDFNFEGDYILNGTVAPRPVIGLPTAYTITANTDWVILDVPAGTEVEIDGEVVGTTDETGLTLSFAAPGVWPVTLRPPFPWVEASCEVTVT
jgi:hypothetical protein